MTDIRETWMEIGLQDWIILKQNDILLSGIYQTDSVMTMK
jgi:hypothetical protein